MKNSLEYTDQELYEERINSLEDMLSRTTTYMEKIQEELEISKNKLQLKNKYMEDSINYASIIQQAILPNENLLSKIFKKFFVYHHQKDVVGGDFPFVMEREGIVYIAAVDCTGHGVSGSLISMAGFFILQQVIQEQKDYCCAGDVLTAFNHEFYNYFHFYHNGDQPHLNVGMDLSLLIYNKEKKCISFSGARRPVIYFDNELKIIKTDKVSVGETNDYEFTNHKQLFDESTMFYLFSDGLTDQFGNVHPNKPFGEKVKLRRVKEFLKQIQHLDGAEQKEKLVNFLDQWKRGSEQTDDILVLGFEF